MNAVSNSAEELSAAMHAQTPSLAAPAGCPSVEDLMAWSERREQRDRLAFSEHLQKCPRCAHLLEQAIASGIDAGIEDQDLLTIQPDLRLPALSADKEPRADTAAKNKNPAAKVPATTWELLTGRPAHPRKS